MLFLTDDEKLSEIEIDEIVLSQADDDSAWEEWLIITKDIEVDDD